MTESVKRKHPLAKCEECPLYSKGKYVPSSPPTAKSNGIAFVGESPGNTEKAKGKVFIGESGKLLNVVLDAHGINRDESLLTNAALCNYKVEDKDELPAAISACRPRLLQELKDSGITKAVTLGNSAAKSLLDTKVGITQLRKGDPRPSDYTDVSVIPTFHPAAALRHQANMPLLVDDIGKVNPRPKLWRDPKITIITEVDRAARFLRNTKTTYPIYFDVENGVEKEKSYEFDTRLLCVGIGSSHPNHGDRVVVIGAPAVTDPTVLTEMYKLIARVGVICQNNKHDVRVMEETNVHDMPLPQMGDTMLASYACNENPGTHSLKYMIEEHLSGPDYEQYIKPYLVKPKDPPEQRGPAIEYLKVSLASKKIRIRAEVIKGRPEGITEAAVKHAAEEMNVTEFKDEGASYKRSQIRWMLDPAKTPELAPLDADGSYASIPPAILYKYNAFDVQGTRQLDQEVFAPRLREEGLEGAYKHVMVMSNALARPEKKGLTVDLDYNKVLDEKFQKELEVVGDFPFNAGSHQQVKEYFLSEFGLQLDSTDKDTLVELRDTIQDNRVTELIDKLLEYKRVKKYQGTYVTSIRNQALRNNGRVSPTFKIDQATTGRLASKNPNVQNMPRKFDIKRQFVPSAPNRVFIHADMAQLELRTITHLAQDQGMMDLFNDPTRDLFDELTMSVYSMSKDEFYDKKKNSPGEIKEKRVIVKAFAYGTILDRSAPGIAMDGNLNLTIKEAEDRMGIFQRQIPGIIKYQEQIKNDVLAGKDLVNLFGRRRRFHVITNSTKKELLRQAIAFQPQSTASDICVTALSKLPEYMDPRNIIHDAILLECEIDDVQETGKELMRIMIDTAEEWCPTVKFDAEATWGWNWQEAAEPNKDKSNVITLD